MERAYVTVLTSENYIPGVKALKKSLIKTKTKYHLIVLIPKNSTFKNNLISNKIIDEYCLLMEHDGISFDFCKNINQKKKHWINTFFKLTATDLVQFKKIVLLDSDMLVMKNIDILFDKPHYSAAVAGECSHKYRYLNSGLLVLEPSRQLYNTMIERIPQTIKNRLNNNLNVGDQDVFHAALPTWSENKALKLTENFNCFFEDLSILHKSFNYNEIYIVHFKGAFKPWMKIFSKNNFKILFALLTKFKFWNLIVFLKYIYYAISK